MDLEKKLNTLLVTIFQDLMDIEQKALITGEFRDITLNDMHVIEAVGQGNGANMSSIARKLDITVGSLTTAMNSLVKKKYVERYRSEEDRRVVFVKLTEKGVRAYVHHEDYHRQMTQAILDRLEGEEIAVLLKTLDTLKEFFASYQKLNAPADEPPVMTG